MTRTTFRQEDVLQDGDFATSLEGGPTDLGNPWLRPGVGAWTSVLDLARWAELLPSGDEAFLSQPLFDEALEPHAQLAVWSRVHWGLLGVGFEGLWSWDVDDLANMNYPYDLRVVEGGFSNWFGQSSMLLAIPSRGFSLLYRHNASFTPMPRAVVTATATVLALPELAPSAPGDDRDPATYAGTYVRDDGTTTRVSLRQHGGLRLSSPAATWSRSGRSASVRRGVHPVGLRLDEDGAVRDMELQGYWVARPQ